MTFDDLFGTLTVKERAFFLCYLETFNFTRSYQFVYPRAKKSSAKSNARRLFKRIIEKVDWREILRLYGLDDFRLAREIDNRLKATVVKFHLDKKLGDFADNATRMKATALLAEMFGRRKFQLEFSGEVVHKGYYVHSPDDWPDKDDKDSSAL